MFEKTISAELENLLAERGFFLAESQKEPRMAITGHETGENKITAQAVVSIISNGDPVGAVIMLSTNASTTMGELELKLAQSAAGFLGKQMEQ